MLFYTERNGNSEGRILEIAHHILHRLRKHRRVEILLARVKTQGREEQQPRSGPFSAVERSLNLLGVKWVDFQGLKKAVTRSDLPPH